MTSVASRQLEFTAMVRQRLKILSKDRLSKARVDQRRTNSKERALLYNLAEGMRLPLLTGCRPNGKEPPTALRATYVKVHAAVDVGDAI